MTFTIEQCQEYRRQWISELRNGDREQAQEVLANEDYSEFCCLGVAEDFVGPTLPDEMKIKRGSYGTFVQQNPDWLSYDFESDEDDDDFYHSDYPDEFIEADANLHTDLRHALGLSTEQETILITLNDEVQVSFEGIASVVESMNYHVDGKEYTKYGSPASKYYE